MDTTYVNNLKAYKHILHADITYTDIGIHRLLTPRIVLHMTSCLGNKKYFLMI